MEFRKKLEKRRKFEFLTFIMGKRIFIFEYVSGGGFNKDEIPISLFCEGFGMLVALIKDFMSLGYEVCTLIDYRIHHLSTILPINNRIIVKKDDNFLNHFKILVKDSDYSFIIAPDSRNVLFNLTRIVKKYNKILLSINLEGINIGSSKMNTYEFFQKNKLLTPKTYLIPFKKNKLDINFIVQKFDDLKKTIIIKPEDGVGAESIFLFETKEQIKNFFQDYYSKIDTKRSYILQEYIEGKDLSISLIGLQESLNKEFKNPFILTINSQNVSIKNPKYDSEYLGGYTPINNYQQITLELTEILDKVDFSSFTGYFGIDLIRSEESKYYFIEINPRLTTSYIGIRNVINQNPSKLILESKLGHSISKNVKVQYTSIFRKLDLVYTKSKFYKQSKVDLINELIRLIPELVTPPISLNESNPFTCFIATKTKDLTSSKKRIQEIHQILRTLSFDIVK
jgi:predicted ATP-grasp superfamily ATP-dependent carboligase